MVDAALRVMTFNIHHGVGTDGAYDLSRIASVIRAQAPDVVALQEVDRQFGPRSEHADQPSWLAQSLGMQLWFGPAIRIGTREYGNAVLTTEAVAAWNWSPLPMADGAEPRSLLRCTLQSGLQVWATHLSNDSTGARKMQARAILERWHARPAPTVILGDFNADPEDPAMSILGGQFGDVWATLRGDEPGFTFRADRPRIRIDYVLVTADLDQRGIELVDVGSASDHHAVVADLGLPR